MPSNPWGTGGPCESPEEDNVLHESSRSCSSSFQSWEKTCCWAVLSQQLWSNKVVVWSGPYTQCCALTEVMKPANWKKSYSYLFQWSQNTGLYCPSFLPGFLAIIYTDCHCLWTIYSVMEGRCWGSLTAWKENVFCRKKSNHLWHKTVPERFRKLRSSSNLFEIM